MNSHKNARLTYARRLQMVVEVIQGRASVPRAARSHGVSDKTARKWLGRYLALGEPGLVDASTALFEARRCLSCGNCFECDNCYGVCPDNAVLKLGPGKGFEFKYDYCKGCGVCVAECPCGAIEMVPEDV